MTLSEVVSISIYPGFMRLYNSDRPEFIIVIKFFSPKGEWLGPTFLIDGKIYREKHNIVAEGRQGHWRWFGIDPVALAQYELNEKLLNPLFGENVEFLQIINPNCKSRFKKCPSIFTMAHADYNSLAKR